MRKTLHVFAKKSYQKTALLAFLVFGTAGIVTYTSCSKKDATPDNAKFIGTWTASSGDKITFTAGADGNHLTQSATSNNASPSDPSCDVTINLIWSVSGSSLTLAQTTITDACSNAGGVAATGTLSGSTLTLNISSTDVIGTTQSTTSFTKQ
jgi:hypothetical protein